VTFASASAPAGAGLGGGFAVLEHDPADRPLEALVGQTARLTLVGGEIVTDA